MADYVYNLLTKHHSVREFKDEKVPEDDVNKMIEAGQRASTSNFLQTYSIIGIEDINVKEALKEVSGQPYVVENGYLFIFVMDYYKHIVASEDSDVVEDVQEATESAESLLVGAIDVGLLAQNIAATAEDMGYGIVYLGSLRNDIGRMRDILDLPDHTFPLFGMAVGVPADSEEQAQKPRMPKELIFHQDRYDNDVDNKRELLKTYDEAVRDYYQERTDGDRDETWSQQVTNFLSGKHRLDMLDQLNKAGFIRK